MVDQDDSVNPAEKLVGVVLPDGWSVIEKIKRGPKATGGHFSVGYLVRHSTGREGFLKALDFARAHADPDPPRALQFMTTIYNFERDLLRKCKNRGLTRIVVPLADGVCEAPGVFGSLKSVNYLIFEKADGDIRNVLGNYEKLEVSWSLRSLHHIATAVKQLHTNGIAHQDVKPSNVLIFNASNSKLTDLGRASDSDMPSPIDSLITPGDKTYAPPDQFYDRGKERNFHDRCIADLYLLGSLVFYYFGGASATHSIMEKFRSLIGSHKSTDVFEDDLPYIQQAFQATLDELRVAVNKRAGFLPKKHRDSIVELAKQLCDPDPNRRGDPSSIRAKHIQQYNLERYISAFNCLAVAAELYSR